MRRLFLSGALVALVAAIFLGSTVFGHRGLNEDELSIAKSLSLSSLPQLTPDPSNRFADNANAAALGELLFNDKELSGNAEVACATCHLESRQFQDDLPLAQGMGETARRTMPLRGVGYSQWLFWDGRKDSLWSQALGPIESAVEHGFTRAQIYNEITGKYSRQYGAIFGPLPDFAPLLPASPLGDQAQQARWKELPLDTQKAVNLVFANTGKAIAAFERTLTPQENRFDRFVDALIAQQAPKDGAILTDQEIEGFRLFTGKGQCLNCHSGARFTDEFFHNTGVGSTDDPVTDFGRASAILLVENDPFNCLGDFSDASEEDCAELRFMSRDPHVFERAFKAPSLREVATRPPYMHAGQIATLADVIEHYNRAPQAPSGHSELTPLNLSEREKKALLAFLKTL